LNREWAPKGVDRFYNLVKVGFFQDIACFRVLKDFVVQFGIHGDPEISKSWKAAKIMDDPVVESNKKGTITFATAGKDTRTSQLFINLRDNLQLDKSGFTPFGKVISGLEVVESFYSDYGEGAPMGKGPSQEMMQREGNKYLKDKFPKLDYVKSAKLL